MDNESTNLFFQNQNGHVWKDESDIYDKPKLLKILFVNSKI